MPKRAQRLSVLAQTVALLEEGILEGRWAHHLPQERLLCEELGISRSTLRRSLPKIEALGLISPGERGTRRRILKVNTSKKLISSETSVAWLTVEDPQEFHGFIKSLYMELQKKLINQGASLQVVILPHKVLNDPAEYLESWLSEQAHDLWILHLMPDPVQQWFSANNTPCYLFGNRAKNTNLPGISVNNAPAIQHALNMLSRLGHTHLALLRHESDHIGEVQSEEAFTEATSNIAKGSVMLGSEDRERMHKLLSRHFLATERSTPTALICTLSNLALFATTWLQAHGISVPRAVSVILLRPAPGLKHIYPSLAHYAVPEHTIVPAALPAIIDLLQTGVCSDSEISLIPEFVAGESLAKLDQGSS